MVKTVPVAGVTGTRAFSSLDERDIELAPAAAPHAAVITPITLEWRRLNAWAASAKKDARSKQVVHDCWGVAQPGRLLALMGPSGSGKTTLLNILAERPTLGEYGTWTGDVTANGRRSLPSRAVGYVMQRDIFFDDLTVREHLRCTAALRLPSSWSKAQKAAELDRVVALLRLGPALDTMVGGGTTRGISGGELKRLNIATELLALPQLLVLDEPLSGLDSALADIVVGALVETARTSQTTVVISVHQPSPTAWASFDDVLLMAAGGHTAFFGVAASAGTQVAEIIRRPMGERAAAEWIIDCVSAEGDRAALLAAHAARVVPPDPPVGALVQIRPHPSFVAICGAILRRNFANTRRREMKKLEWILTFGLSLVFSTVFFGVGTDPTSRPKDYISILFFFVAHWSFHPVFKAIGAYPRQRDVLTRERSSDSYPIGPWFVANVLGEWMVAWAHPLIFYAISWPIAAMPLAVAPRLYCITMLNYETFLALGNLIAALVFDGDQARIIVVVVMVFMMLAGGFFVNLSDPRLPEWLSSVQYVSIQHYTFGLYVRNALSDAEYAAFGPTLKNYSFSQEVTLVNAAVLAGVAGVLRSLAFLQIRFTKKLQFA